LPMQVRIRLAKNNNLSKWRKKIAKKSRTKRHRDTNRDRQTHEKRVRERESASEGDGRNIHPTRS
jgi:hypothetical protein